MPLVVRHLLPGTDCCAMSCKLETSEGQKTSNRESDGSAGGGNTEDSQEVSCVLLTTGTGFGIIHDHELHDQSFSSASPQRISHHHHHHYRPTKCNQAWLSDSVYGTCRGSLH